MDELKVNFQVSNGDKLDSFATVVTSEKVEKSTNLVGVEFHGLLPEVQKQLMEFLHEISPEKTQEN
jgi:c-di-GMP-binding flagellar brake protein YcgR